MLITLITEMRIFSLSLPERVSGKYWLCDTDENGHARRVINVEGVQGRWCLQSSETLAILSGEGMEEVNEMELSEGTSQIGACYRETGKWAVLFVEPTTKDRQSYRRYRVSGPCSLRIGNRTDNQIVFESPYASSSHGILSWDGTAWTITDTNSTNKIFVNGERVTERRLEPGDAIYIVGMKIIAADGFFAVNDPDGLVTVNSDQVSPLSSEREEPTVERPLRVMDREPFYRSPRFCRKIVRGEIQVDGPPARQKVEETPVALVIGPALTMGLTAVLMGAVAILNLSSGKGDLLTTLPTLAMSFSMLCATLLWPSLTRRSEKKRKAAVEEARQRRYREYLDDVRDQIYELKRVQTEILLENCPDPEACEARILRQEPNLWERSASHDDFLRLRLGLGEIPLDAEIRFPGERFSMEDDNLMKDMLRLAAEPKRLEKVPVTCSLRENPVTGVVGEAREVYEFAQGLVLQIASLHSYDEVKLVVLADEGEMPKWSALRWLPHIRSEDGGTRYFAANESEVKTLSAELERVLTERLESAAGRKAAAVPHYVLLVASIGLAEKAKVFEQILSAPKEAGFSCVVLAHALKELPKECSTAIELHGDSSVIYDRSDLTGERHLFAREGFSAAAMERAAKELGNLRLDVKGGDYALPGMLTFLEMYGVGKVDHLNVLTRWKESDPVHTLEAPIGVGGNGDVFYLDLHEKFHGPHGLVAGMTGSGKSELILTYILSLAVNYDPDTVEFILIDYKGGGLAGAFEDTEKGIRLPHLAGTITNLDGAAVKRSLISIQSELRRRQVIFNEAKRVSGEGTVDIYKYQKMYRNGLVTEAVPHLFIISDEFAELKAQQPEFMSQLISTARIGRSLGVHLILATQKPSGVVDDQIWSNSRCRVCLKVQEHADSMDMLKRPDAAELAETGRFYLQVGFNELFAKGQSAWSGAPYIPADRLEKKRDDRVVVMDRLGRVLAEAAPRAASGVGTGKSQVVSIVEYLSELAKEENVAARQLWMPPIPAMIYLKELRKKYGWKVDPLELEPVLGEYDDPFNQTQNLLTLSFSRQGNTLLYGGVGSGKTTLLNTMLYGLMSDYTAERLNIYIVDLDSETLTAFREAPQVGDVLLSGDGDRLAALLKMLQEEMAARKQIMARTGGDFRAYCRQAETPLPHILVVLRNYSAFVEQFEQMEETFLQLTREGSKYGIYFLVTANAGNAVRYRVVQNFAQTLALQLNDRLDYVGILGNTEGVYPSRIKGRGIFKRDKTYEFQVAHIADGYGQEEIRAFCKELNQEAAVRARPVPTLPRRVTADTFREKISWEAFPVGVEKESLRACRLDLSRSVVTMVLTQDLYAMGEVAQGLAETLTRVEGATVTVWDGDELFSGAEERDYRYFRGKFEPQVDLLFEEMVMRHNTCKDAKNEGRPIPAYPRACYLITGYNRICAELSEQGRDRLVTLMEKAEAEHNVHFIVCDNKNGAGAFSGSGWYRRHAGDGQGLWIGEGVSGQSLLKVNKLTGDLYAELPPRFGYAVRRGRPVLVKFLEPRGREGRSET